MIDTEKPCGGPFDLSCGDAYARWRREKLGNRPRDAADLRVEIDGLAQVTAAQVAQILGTCRRANMAIYRCRDREASRDLVRGFAAGLGLGSLDRHLCADEGGVTALEVAAAGARRAYVPYSDRGLSWHTDGYYNTAAGRIRGVVLHCARAAPAGGGNALLDHEIAYIRLRDENPDFIAALMHPDCLTIPANELAPEGGRPAVSGPVFSVDPAGNPNDGALHMRYSARKRHVVWRHDGATRAAVAFLNELLDDPSGPALAYRLQPGEGLVSNNVLHNRAAFEDDPGRGRLIFRARSHDRVGETCRKHEDDMA